MIAASDTSCDTLVGTIRRAKRGGTFLVMMLALVVLTGSVLITVPNVVVVPGIVRAGSPTVKIRYPQPTYLVGISVGLSAEVRQGDTLLELAPASADRAGVRKPLFSPVDGTVTGLNYVATGTLIPAFDTIVEITPGDSAPLIELLVDPRHASLFVSRSVVPIVSSTGAGEFQARVLSTQLPHRGRFGPPAIRVVLKPVSARSDGSPDLLPGMSVNARVPLGESSLLGKFLHPIRQRMDDAFSR